MKKVLITAAVAIVTIAAIAFKPAGDSKKVTMVISHEVKDYATWRKGFDADKPNRDKGGINIIGVYSSVDNPNMVTVIGEAPSAEAAKGMTSSPELKAAMERAGVISKPEFKILSFRD